MTLISNIQRAWERLLNIYRYTKYIKSGPKVNKINTKNMTYVSKMTKSHQDVSLGSTVYKTLRNELSNKHKSMSNIPL